jgi:hypothetical protein
MAVMARIIGIPARVAVGFTAGTLHGGLYQVTTHDAHAWPELYFPGYGWLPFEPTPRADGQATTPPYAQGKGGASKPSVGPSAGASSAPKGGLPTNVHPLAGIRGTGTSASSGHNIPAIGTLKGTSYTAVLTLLIVVAALVLLAVPGLARLIVRRRRWRALNRDPGAVSGGGGLAWVELRDTMIDLGIPWDDGRTPRQIAASLLVAAGPEVDVRASLQRLARSEERARYAAVAVAADAGGRNDIDLVRAAVIAGRSRLQRARAVVLPTSTLRVAGDAMLRAGAVVDQVSRLGRSLRRSLIARTRLRPT